MYQPLGELTKKVKTHLENYISQMSEIPTNELILAHSPDGEQLKYKASKLSKDYRSIGTGLKSELEYEKKQIEKDKQSLFFPKSTSYDSNRRNEGMTQRLLAQQFLNSGELSKEALIQIIDSNLLNDNLDFVGQIRESLFSRKNVKNYEDHLAVTNHLNNIYKARGLDKIEAREQDLNEAEQEFNGFKLRFPSLRD